MDKINGFLTYERKDGPVVEVKERVKNFSEFHLSLDDNDQIKQAARCMNCGVPFCQAGVRISGMLSGCPLNNLIPEINELVYRGKYELAYKRLAKTSSFPEFTSRVCPALCENACTVGLHLEPVSTKENEKKIIEYAFSHELVKEDIPEVRTGKKVAIIGSGPAGLAAAKSLNARGHFVTVYERSDRVGGLLRYGIPNMKLEKHIIDRRIKLMEEAGIVFKTGVNVCGDDNNLNKDMGTKTTISAEEITKEFDAVILACGASNPRNISVPGREAKGIYFAVDFLSKVTKSLLDIDYKGAKDNKKIFGYNEVYEKNVVVIGGGDTGNDCVGTAIRLGAKSVTQLEMMPCPSKERKAGNPWPEWPKVLKTDYGQEEAIDVFGHDPRIYKTTVKEFVTEKTLDDNGNTIDKIKKMVIVSLEPKKDEKTGRIVMDEVKGSEKTIEADLVLIAAGFLGSEAYVTNGFKVETDLRTNVKTLENNYRTNIPKIYTAGDMHTGQSLVVNAISDGRRAAKQVDKDLMGYV